jgi:Flp pilus assembly pilin Flp
MPGRFRTESVRPSAAISSAERFFRSDRAIAITEYGLLIALIAIVVIGVIVIFGGGITSWFGSKTGAITTY